MLLAEAERILSSRAGRQPIFVWVHLWTPHHFYLPPAPFLNGFDSSRELDDFTAQAMLPRTYGHGDEALVRVARARYDENIAYGDAQVGDFLERAERRGLLRNAIVTISADHGESFDHGIIGHGGRELWDSMIRVPLIMRIPGQVERVDVAATAEQIDILPTLLDVAGVGARHEHDGESLLPGMRAGGKDSDAISMWLELESVFDPLRRGRVSIVRWPSKLVFDLDASREPMLFDLARDPGEEHDRHREDSARVTELEGAARAALARAEGRSPASAPP
jgi:arylsulfatase A-like enzyme